MIEVSILASLIFFLIAVSLANILTLIFAVVLAHTINHLFNGHGYQILFAWLRLRLPFEKRMAYIRNIGKRLYSRGSAAIVYGSFGIGDYDEFSDIDIFVINTGTFLSKLSDCFNNTYERFYAFLSGVSLDIYSVEKVPYLEWRIDVQKKDKLILLSDPKGVLASTGLHIDHYNFFQV